MNSEDSDDKYLFNNIYDEIIEDLESETDSVERPLCDSLKGIDKEYSDFQPLAQGGMKRIFKVFDKKLNRYVAYARLHPNSPQDLHDPFIREARLTALLEHPNIISVYDIGINEDDCPFFTMELKVGKSLSDIISETPGISKPGTDSFIMLLESFIKVCDALSYAHSKNVVHLDLKPENIQIGKFGEVIVCDWGLGKVIGDTDIEYDQLLFNPDLLNNVTLTNKIVGTPGYMAPEQVSGDDKTKYTDIYSLGAMLYTILTGKLAFSGDIDSILEQTLNGTIQEPLKLNLDWEVPEGLNAVLTKAMHLKPEDRYQSVENLRREVQSYLNGHTTIAEKAGLLKEAKLFYKRNKISCNIFLAGLLTVLILGTAFLFKLQQHNVQLSQEKEKAEFNRHEAVVERNRYKSALDLMHIEKDLATALLNQEADIIHEIFNQTDNAIYDSPIKALKKAEELIRQIPQSSRAYNWTQVQQNYIHYLRQDFHLFKAISPNDEELKKMLDGFSKNGRNYLVINDLISFIKQIMKNEYDIADVVKILRYDGAVRESKEDHIQGLEIFLKKLNPKWTGALEYKEGSLKISGTGFSKYSLIAKELYQRAANLSRPVCVLGSIPIMNLDISHTDIKDLSHLSSLKIEELNIKSTKISDIENIYRFKFLKKLIISKDSPLNKDLHKLRKLFDVEIK